MDGVGERDGWKAGRREEWKRGRLEEEGKVGRLEEGWVEEGMGGRLYEWKEEAQSNRMCYRCIKIFGVGGRVMRDERDWRKIAQSNRMCYRYIKMVGRGKG